MLSSWCDFIVTDASSIAVPISVSSHVFVFECLPHSVFMSSVLNGASHTTDGDKHKVSVSLSFSLSAPFKANSIYSVWYGPHTLQYNPANSVNVWKGAAISRNMVGVGKRPVRIQNGGMWCKAAGSCGSDLWPWFPGCHRCWHPVDSACHCNADIQTLNVSPSRLELRTHLNLDTDQECIKYLTVELTRSRDLNSDPRSVLLFLEASRTRAQRLV